jgi:gamma-glutamyltranspeptidase
MESEPQRRQQHGRPVQQRPANPQTGRHLQRGIVAAQSRKAAEVGAEVLAAGGDCVDAVIATTFALGVLEPWMSGVGGGGAMVLYRAREDRYEAIDYGMRAPGGLRPEDYPLTGDGAASDIFPWVRVKDDRNLHGPGSIAVPGVVAAGIVGPAADETVPGDSECNTAPG